MEDKKKHTDPQTEGKKSGKAAKRIKRVILFVLLAPFVIALLLQVPVIQNWSVDRITSYLSSRMSTKVDINKLRLKVFGGLEMNSFIMEDTDQDTILYASSLQVSLKKSLFSLFNGELHMNDIALRDGFVRLKKEKGNTSSNLALLLDKLSDNSNADDTKNKGMSPLSLDVGEIRLNNVGLSIVDENDGTLQDIKVGDGKIVIEKFDQDNKDIVVSEIILANSQIRIKKFSDKTEIQSNVTGIPDTVLMMTEVDSSWTERPKPFIVEVKKLKIENGIFSYNDMLKEKDMSYEDVLDFNHFELNDLTVDIENLFYSDGFDIDFDLKDFGFKDDKGFVLESLSCDSVHIDNGQIDLPGFAFISENSKINSSLNFSFDDFGDFGYFEDNIYIRSKLNGSQLLLGDLMHFVRKINDDDFFVKNKNRVAVISGDYRGFVNNLRGRDIAIKFGNDFIMEGSITARNISEQDQALIYFKLNNLRTSIPFLKRFVPGFNPPSSFYELGNISFKGRFEGYLKDFVASGNMQTEIGAANLDMRLDIKDGNSMAQYSGEMGLIDFDLGRWSGNTDLGTINFNAFVKDGRGLSMNNAYADLNAVVSGLTYKDYAYQNFTLDGQIAESSFKGDFEIDDENADLTFSGTMEIVDKTPYFDFVADIDNLNLKNLNLSDSLFNFSGNIDMNMYGSDLNTAVGTILANDFNIEKNDTLYHIDTISIISSSVGSDFRKIEFYSDVADGELKGNFVLSETAHLFKDIVTNNYPDYVRHWEIDTTHILPDQDFTFRIRIPDSKNIFDLIGAKDLRIYDFSAKGKIDGVEQSVDIDALIPFASYKNNEIRDGHFNLSSVASKGRMWLTTESSKLVGQQFNAIDIETSLSDERIFFKLTTDNVLDSLQRIDMRGKLAPHDKGFALTIDNEEWIMLGKQWDFVSYSPIVIGKDYLEINDFLITDGYREIVIKDIANKGLKTGLRNFDFISLKDWINYDKLEFAGEGNLDIEIGSLYDKPFTFSTKLDIPEFLIDSVSFGRLEFSVHKPLETAIGAVFEMSKDTFDLRATASYDMNKEHLDASISASNLPLIIFKLIIEDGISDVQGTADISSYVKGPVNDLEVRGEGLLKKGGAKIDYLGSHFFFDKQTLKISEDFIDATGQVITDIEGNEAVLTGGLRHKLFEDFTQDFNISAQNGVILNTGKFDNPIYYGYGKGVLSADFSGTFGATNIIANAVTGPGTRLNIPVTYYQEGHDESFISFINKEDLLNPKPLNTDEEFKIEGLDVEMNLTFTPDAEVSIIFNETLGDIVRGTGRGDLKVYATRSGEFEIFGEYQIEQGEYLFTALGLVAKPFQVRRGGLIKWTGDPINAEMDIEAEYEVRAPLITFLSEYALTPELEQEARKVQDIELELHIGGTLYSPIVSFDLSFPNLTGELRTYAESKIRTIRANELALNNQVVGLLISNSFVPTNNLGSSEGFGSSDFLQSAGISTLSEFVSSQLSIMLTGLIQEALSENGFISGIDFDIGLRQNSSLFGDNPNTGNIIPDEIEIHLNNKFRFLDERLSLNLGGNYVREAAIGIGNYLVGDFVLEYYISNDRKIKLRMYGRNDVDQISQKRRFKYGLGIGYRTEFGDLFNLQKNLNESVRNNLTTDTGSSQ